MSIKSDSYLLTRFELGDVPDQQDFIDLIDSKVNVAAGSGGEGKNYVSQANAESGSIDDWASYNDSIAKSFADTDINVGTDEITVTAHGFRYNDQVYITDALGTNITINSRYYVIVVDANTISLSETLAGPLFDITGAPTAGSSTVVNTEPVDGTAGTTGITLTTSLVNPIRGLASYIYSVPASQQAGTGWSYDFEIENADRAKTLKFKFELSVVSGGNIDDGDIEAFIYDTSNNNMIPVTPSKVDAMIQGNESQYLFYGTFQTAIDSLTYRMLIHWRNPVVAAHVIKIDSFSIGPQPSALGVPSSDFVPYTVEIKGVTSDPTKGTVTVDQGRWRRVGDSAEITYDYRQTVAGSAGSGQYEYSMPPGLFIDVDKMASAALTQTIRGSGFQTNGVSPTPIAAKLSPYDLFGVGGGFTILDVLSDMENGSSAYPLSSASLAISITVVFPIKGWSSNVVMSSDTDSRKFSVVAHFPDTSAAADVPTIFSNVEENTHGTYDDTTGRTVIPYDGYYLIGATVDGNFGSTTVYLSVNGETSSAWAKQHQIGVTGADGVFTFGSTIKKLKAGDIIDVRSTTGYSGGGNYGRLFIVNVPAGSPAIMATEKILAKVFKTANQSIPDAATTQMTYDQAVKDTHAAFNFGTSEFVCPVNGDYRVYGNVAWDQNGTGHRIVVIHKNGVFAEYGCLNSGFASATNVFVFNVTLCDCVAGDMLSVYVHQTTGAALNVQGVSPLETSTVFERI